MAVGVRRIIVNTATGTGARVAALGIVFLTTPVLINHLGAEAFGLLAIVAALPAYAGLLDFGIGPGLVRHLTEYSEYGDLDGVMEVMTLSLCFYVLLGVIFAPLVALLAPDVIRLFSVPEQLRWAAVTSILIMFFYFIVSGIVGVFSARLVSLHRMDVTATVGLLGQIVYGVLVFVVIPISPTVLTAVWLNVIQLLITGVLLFAIVLRTDNHVFCNPLGIRGALIRKLFVFGGWMQLNSLTALVNLEADKLIIAGFLDIATVTPYQIGNRLASLNRLIPFQLLSAVMPAATIIQIGRTREEAEEFYCHISRYLMLLTLSITGFTAVAADRLIVTWIGRPYPQATLIVLALSVSLAVNNLTGGGTTMVRAAGQPRYETYYALVSMVLNIGLTIALAPRFGLAGILGGTIIANLIGSAYFVILFHRRFGFPWFRTMGDWLWRLLAATGLACLGVYLVLVCQPSTMPADRVTGLLLLVAYGIVYLMLFFVGLTLLAFWSDRDIDVFRRISARFIPFGSWS
jgi:O-antigen/teichoic acid export membrane protein